MSETRIDGSVIKPGTVSGEVIQDGSVKGIDIAPQSITDSHIHPDAKISADKLIDGVNHKIFSAEDKAKLDAINGTGGSSSSLDINYSNPSFPDIASVKDALDKLLYTAPVINSFSNNVNTVEKGVTINSLTLTWSLNKEVTSQSIDNGIGSIPVTDRSKMLTGLSITNNTTYTLTISDGKNTVSRSTSVSFLQKRYWGASSYSTLTSNDILLLGNSEFSSTRVQSKTLSGSNQYFYFAYPVSFGVATFKVNGLPNTAWVQTTVNFKNASGYSEDYYVYRSTSLQNGSGLVIDIS